MMWSLTHFDDILRQIEGVTGTYSVITGTYSANFYCLVDSACAIRLSAGERYFSAA